MIRHTSRHRASPDTAEPEERWQDSGICAAPQYALAAAEIWFPHERDRKTIRYAKSVCASCPVQPQCQEWALAEREEYGIWGGLTERERVSILRRTSRDRTASRAQEPVPKPAKTGRKPAACGTRSGYQRHVRKGEPIDDACRAANTAADARLRRTGSTKALV
ncbi:WhiB family transcriptional regulator [Streptomyces lasiicapitis]|uniref:WhiB family transcriptional regulator n=1 Tax=Streptomyces lasiicapitis TaxID=1923961 RepID=UPI00366A2875